VTSKDDMRHVPPNNGMQRTALRTAADTERWADETSPIWRNHDVPTRAPFGRGTIRCYCTCRITVGSSGAWLSA
jgi:hypothetical protein